MSRHQSQTTLYVRGFGSSIRAYDLAIEFERYGRLVRCDIPEPKTATARRFAFVEYESRRDADDAYHEMHKMPIGRDGILQVEWAKRDPSANWRFDRDRDSRRDGGRGYERRDRSPAPRRRSRSPAPRHRDYSPRGDRRDRDRDRDRDYDRRDRGGRDRSRTPDDGLRDRDMKDVRERRSDDDDEPAAAPAENGNEGDAERKESPPPRPAEDELDTAE